MHRLRPAGVAEFWLPVRAVQGGSPRLPGEPVRVQGACLRVRRVRSQAPEVLQPVAAHSAWALAARELGLEGQQAQVRPLAQGVRVVPAEPAVRGELPRAWAGAGLPEAGQWAEAPAGLAALAARFPAPVFLPAAVGDRPSGDAVRVGRAADRAAGSVAERGGAPPVALLAAVARARLWAAAAGAGGFPADADVPGPDRYFPASAWV